MNDVKFLMHIISIVYISKGNDTIQSFTNTIDIDIYEYY